LVLVAVEVPQELAIMVLLVKLEIFIHPVVALVLDIILFLD
jgi:hypothetical protein